MSAGFAERMNRMREELSARDATVSSIARYFEDLVADLTDRVHRDPKTRLMNFRRFIEQLEAFLALEQRGRWCAVGLVDITSFKWYNDTLGHALGDRIIDRVARLLREQVRSDDLIAQESADLRTEKELHARFGGDEFCFLIPDLDHFTDALVIAERFREAVARYEWTSEDPRLVEKPVQRGRRGRLPAARRRCRSGGRWRTTLAQELLERADKLMYEAKDERAERHPLACACVWTKGALIELGPDEHVGVSPRRPAAPLSLEPPAALPARLCVRQNGGCSSGVERLTVAQEVAGSRPVTHPKDLFGSNSLDLGLSSFWEPCTSRKFHGLLLDAVKIALPKGAKVATREAGRRVGRLVGAQDGSARWRRDQAAAVSQRLQDVLVERVANAQAGPGFWERFAGIAAPMRASTAHPCPAHQGCCSRSHRPADNAVR